MKEEKKDKKTLPKAKPAQAPKRGGPKYASKEEFDKALAKVRVVHADLIKSLA